LKLKRKRKSLLKEDVKFIKNKNLKKMKSVKEIKRFVLIFILLLFNFVQSCDNSASSSYQFKIAPKAFAEDLFSIYQVTPDEAMEWMFDSTMAIFVDVRGKYEYERGHIENAINIPLSDLLDEENKALYENWLKDSITVVLYGNDELEANAPWMLMYQLGYTNMRVLLGGYGYIDRLYLDQLEDGEVYSVEDPQYDFAGIILKVKEEKEKPTEVVVPAPKKVEKKKEVIIEKKVKKAAEGGC
jgi:rhodanese-related sulfurtransferase